DSWELRDQAGSPSCCLDRLGPSWEHRPYRLNLLAEFQSTFDWGRCGAGPIGPAVIDRLVDPRRCSADFEESNRAYWLSLACHAIQCRILARGPSALDFLADYHWNFGLIWPHSSDRPCRDWLPAYPHSLPGQAVWRNSPSADPGSDHR